MPRDRRPGLSVDEARAWLAKRRVDAQVDRPRTLAEMYALRDGHPPHEGARAIGFTARR